MRKYKVVATIVMVIVIFASMLTCAQINTKKTIDSYKGLTFEEMLEARHGEYDVDILKSNEYYLYMGDTDERHGSDIVYQSKELDYYFFNGGPINLKSKLFEEDLPDEVISYSGLRVYKHLENYVIDFSTDSKSMDIFVYDKYGEFESLLMRKQHFYGNYKVWFKSYKDLKDDDEIYISIDGEEHVLLDGKTIKERFE